MRRCCCAVLIVVCALFAFEPVASAGPTEVCYSESGHVFDAVGTAVAGATVTRYTGPPVAVPGRRRLMRTARGSCRCPRRSRR